MDNYYDTFTVITISFSYSHFILAVFLHDFLERTFNSTTF